MWGNRRHVDGLWKGYCGYCAAASSGGLLPVEYGRWNSVFKRSRGGYSSKIHIGVDALGNPLKFIVTAGQAAAIHQAQALLEDYPEAEAVIADKAYDADTFIDWLQARGIEPVIPATANRTQARDYDRHRYKERHLVECLINKLKHYRRVFSRFDKKVKNFLSFLQFAGALIWLR